MPKEYAAALITTGMTLICMTSLVRANGRLDKEKKKELYACYASIAFAAFWEALAVVLDGSPDWTRGIHAVAKCMDYSITPICAIVFIRQISPQGKTEKWMRVVLFCNLVFQVISVFTGWIFYLDADNYYKHGPCYFIYVVVFFLAILFVLREFIRYGGKYGPYSRIPMVLLALVLCLGIVLQEVFEVRYIYLTLTITSVLLYIHYNEFTQIDRDVEIRQQKRELDVDALTGVLSRHAFKQEVARLSKIDYLPENLTAYEIDLNGLKTVNDNLGHEAGDELLKGAGETILETVSKYGNCYRIGGDEFVVLVTLTDITPEQLTQEIKDRAAQWHGETLSGLSLSVGFAPVSTHPLLDIKQLIHEADMQMYLDKERYYSMPGHERRRR